MFYRVLADLVFVVHFAFILFVLFGGAVRLSVALGTMGSSPHGDLGRGGRVIRLVLPSYAA